MSQHREDRSPADIAAFVAHLERIKPPVRNRLFRMRDSTAALLYITHLLHNGISFRVVCTTNGIDIETPFAIALEDFPQVEWMAKP